jgi:hypothetical protein
MRKRFLKVVLAVSCVFLFAAVSPTVGEDFLVIKKKGGPALKVPLQFSPDQIESFHVERGPKTEQDSSVQKAGPSRGEPEEEETQAADQTVDGRGFSGRPKPGTSGPSPSGKEAPGQDATKKLRPDQPPMETSQGTEASPQATRKPGIQAGRSAGGLEGTSFAVSVFKLPDNVTSLPDYTAYKPYKSVKSDTINLDPAKGEGDSTGWMENPDGMGLRFMGMFMVSGEGIFRFRVQAKDGVRVHIDDKTIMENDGIHDAWAKTAFLHLAEGVHTIVVDSFNSKGAPFLKLFVQPPFAQEQIFSISSGLSGWKEPAKPYDVLWAQVYFVPKGDYPDGPDFSRMTPIGRLIASELNISSGGDRFPGLPGRSDMVGLRYQGYFNVSGAGIFAFRLLADTYAKLTIGKHSVAEVNRTNRADSQGSLGWVFLQEGSYPITVDYFHPQGSPKLELYVTQPEKDEEIFSPSKTLAGFSSDSGKLSLIPAFVYFLKPNTRKIPNYNKLTPAGMFFTKAIDYPLDRGSKEFPGVPKRLEWLGLRFYVKFSLGEQEAGQYKFRIVCDDSARLIIGKKIVINAEGLGKVLEQSGSVDLPAGSHEMFVDYLQAQGPTCLQLYITPPGGEEKIFAFQ